MLGLNDQVWVTTAVTDNDVDRSLVLCYSLRRTFTTRKIAVIASSQLSDNLKNALYTGFDFVFLLDETLNSSGLKLEYFAKLYALVAVQSYGNATFVSPYMLALKNCDDIFTEKTDGFTFLENDADATVFLFKPSLEHFKALTTGLKENTLNGSGIGGYLRKWIKNQVKCTKRLSEKYNKDISHSKILCESSEQDISLMNLMKYSSSSDIKMLTKSGGQIENLVAIHWQNVFNVDVKPLLKSTDNVICSAPQSKYTKEPIAIVGMSCRYPGSNNLEEFWELLFQGQDGTGNPPPFRWMREQCSRQKADSKKTNAGFLKVPVDEFDAKFFGISPKEMLFMDPQHRLWHEVIWEGLEDACIDPHSLRGSTGSVFLGSWTNDYKDILIHSGNSEFYRGYMGNSIGAATARLSFLLGLTGPSMATESGCSSAMVAVHLACRSLQLGETNLALAGGVNLLLHPFDKDEMPMVVSPDGHCKTFSEDADGFARAEGCGVLVLKRLSDAMKDNDHIWALIRESAVSQEGVSKSMGTPTVHCESLAMAEALINADVRPEEVSYVEAHGTGTVIGDPMEVAAIAKAYHSPSRKEPLIIGSVKTNVGHTESCSGITGIMKVVLAMQHEVLPPHRNLTKLNPAIDLEAVPAIVPLEPTEWKQNSKAPRIAGVSSFGITGTDAHAIIEEPPIASKKVLSFNEVDRPYQILKISAKTEEALEILIEKLQKSIAASNESLADIAYSLNTGRANFNHRVVTVAKSKEEFITNLKQHKYLKGETSCENLGKICFLFTGQGSQYPGMAEKLYQSSPIFKMHFDYCDKIMNDNYSINIKDILWGTENNSPDEISRTINSQTSIFCLEYALFKLWESWGVKPDYVLGHSLGEFAAAVGAGILSVEDAIKLVTERSKLIDKLPPGKMLAIQADYDEVQNLMEKFAGSDAKKLLDYAAINSSEQTVVAGDSDVIMEFSGFLTGNKIKCIVLAASHAFHSKHMDPMLEKYRCVAKTTNLLKGQRCEYISGMKGDLITKEDMDGEYWVQHTREKVHFLNASKKAVELGCTIFIEIGPQPILSALTMTNSNASLLCLPSLKRKENDWKTILNTLGKLYLEDVEIDWKGLDQFCTRKKIRLPHYPFMGKKFWPDLMQVTGSSIHPLVGSVISNPSSLRLFQTGFNLRTHEYVKDHAIGQTAVFPGAGYLEMSLAAGLATVEGSTDSLNRPSRPMKVENLMIQAPLALEETKTCQIQTVVELNTSAGDNSNDWNDMTIKIFHRLESDSSLKWLQHATATFSPLPTAEDQLISFDLIKFHETLAKTSNDDIISQAYDKLASIGLKFGPTFRSLEKIWEDKERNSLLAKVKVPQNQDNSDSQYILHPVVLDSMIQGIMMLKLTSKLKTKLYVPIKIDKFVWVSNGGDESAEERYLHIFEKCETNSESNGTPTTNSCTALLIDAKGNVLAMMSGVEFIDTTVKAVESILEQQTSVMPDLWEESWRPKLGPAQHRHDVTLCQQERFYDEKFAEDTKKEFNNLSPELMDTFHNLERLVYLNMLRCLNQCGWKPTLNETLHEDQLRKELGIQKQYNKMFGYILGVLQEEQILQNIGPSSWKVVEMPPSLQEIEYELSSPIFTSELVKNFNPTLLFAKIGENYSRILKGTQSALPILFPEEGSKVNWPPVADFYTDYAKHFRLSELFSTVTPKHLQHCKKHCTGEKDIFRILEVGSGTGAFTAVFLEALKNNGVDFEYTYTDISSAFFAAAEKKFEPHLKNMVFKKLNIEDDPINQGFTPNYYDYVVASDVIHATRNLKITLKNVRTLLRTGAKFIMNDMTKVNRFITFLFGLLEGFWRFEDKELRTNHCTLSTKKWIQILEDSGLDVLNIFPSMNNHHGFFWAYKAESCNKLSNESMQPKTAVSWIVFHQENSPTSNYLLDKIAALENRDVIAVTRGEKFQSFSANDRWRFEIQADSDEDFFKMMKCIETEKKCTVEGVLFCWSLDKNCMTQESFLQPYFHATKAVLRMKQNSLPKLIALVNGVMPVEDNDLSGFHSSTIWGFTKALRNERIDINCRVIDIGGKEDAEGVKQIFLELWNADKDTQVAFHDTTRYICKIQAHKPALSDLKLPKGTDRFQLILPETKSVRDLQFGPMPTLILCEDEVEIQVKSSALNFRDVFSVLKPTEQFKDVNAVGFDFAVVVKLVGSKVTLWSVGDKVFGLNVNGEPLPSHIKLNEQDVHAVPDGMTLCGACTLPAVVATSYHCLIDVAKITAADTVLIHTASGGVGLSAIQICKSVGARIMATAGSKRKHNYLRSLGIQHIFHSRNTEYGDKILKVTHGRGVDIVLNSLTSEGFKEATLKACAIGARFVEMSKLLIWKPEEVKKLRPDVQYTVVDVSAFNLEESRKIMAEVKKLAESKTIHPIPYVRFDGLHIREALEYLQKAKHIGKVVCQMPEVRQQNGNCEVHTSMFNENSTYLITGGLGGIGFVVCKWMVEKGASHILLASRNAATKAMQQLINMLNMENGTNVKAVQLDVGDFQQCRELIQEKIPEMGLPPLRGIMHAAGILSNGLIENQTWERLSSTFDTKVKGTLNLHELTKTMHLEHFVLFSSMASLFGSPGQSNHSAGNNFEDSFAQYRNSIGLPAISINWGQWGEVGVATEVDLPGVKTLSNLQGTTGLEYAMKSQRTQTAVINVESFVLFSKLLPYMSTILDERLWAAGKSSGNGSGANLIKSEEFWQQYDSLNNTEGKTEHVRKILRLILRHTLRLDDGDCIEDNANFQEIGVDSLMFVEIKNSIQSIFGERAIVNASALRDSNTVNLLAEALVKVIEGGELEEKRIPTSEEVAKLIHEDSQLAPHITSSPHQQRINIQEVSTILVTGCTGTLGPYILRELTNNSQVKTVICLMRVNKSTSGDDRLRKVLEERHLLSDVDMSKVQCVIGDVASLQLGMESGVWDDLCDSVHAVFHCAANVQHVGHYRKSNSNKDMRAVNIGGTKNVLEFAASGKNLKHVYCASSILAVATLDEDGSFSEHWPEANDYNGVTTVAYPITKFVSDLLMKQAVLERGIPAKVFRFSNIVGDSKTGRFLQDRDHLMLRYLFILKNGVMPSNPVPVQALPVDICAWASTQIFFNSDAPSDIYNILNKSPDLDQEFVSVAKKLGYQVDIVEFSEFIDKIRDSTTEDSPYAIFKDFYKSEEDLLSLYNSAPALKRWIMEGGLDKEFTVSKKMKALLPEFFNDELGSSLDHIYRDLLFAKNNGWFDKF